MMYTIYMDSSSLRASPNGGSQKEDARFDGLVAIPEGLASWALVAPPLWLAYHRLWWVLAGYAFIAVFLMVLLMTPFAIVAILLAFLPGTYLFLEGHQLRRADMEYRGKEMAAVVEASSEKAALMRFLANWEEPARPNKPVSRHVGPPAQNAQAITLFPNDES